ncbi:winged helix DNA-binding domain-containing protein [Basidiobolus meristosporus CBS 931.73]|uniref:Winged helix DNA-binding domain-containing protein n=1 Tax=Basidiobolus meristosporus CBS 931.73 TaxID=1314790 RepID=A0A1Y1Z727_9FUNG|nr:winged helix DNA-binding domain-containing protein [Basidiobolus meristosporus CBS 931.73]|eukprot:ORY06098.1 winged helix DNA-binding domain-containing protein [Basidiobolus meristosporus CBS 931.73]
MPALGSVNTQIPQHKEVSVFVRKLYRMLENDKHAEHIRWNSSGTSFVIPDGPLLAAVVLPQYFKASTFSSFVRQLNNYEFRRISDARKAKNPTSQLASVFTHRNFQRGKYNQLHLIKRSVNRTTRFKSKSHCQDADSDEKAFIPQLISGVDCSSSESEDLRDVKDLGKQAERGLLNPITLSNMGISTIAESPTQACSDCQSLRMEVQVLRQRLRSYEDIFSVNAEQRASIQPLNNDKLPLVAHQPEHPVIKTEEWTLDTSSQEFEIFSRLSWMYDLESPTQTSSLLTSLYDADISQNHSWCDSSYDIGQPASNWDMALRIEDRKRLDAVQITNSLLFHDV